MLVIYHNALNRFQRDIHNVPDSFEALFNCFFSSRHFKIELKVLYAPFPAMILIVVFRVFLHSYIRQVDHHIIKLCHILRVLRGAESCEATRVDPDLQRSITRHKYVKPQIELLSAHKQWLVDVARDNIGLSQVKGLER